MRKFLPIFLLIFAFLFFKINIVYSQNLEQIYQEYKSSNLKFRKSYQKFLLDKNKYLSYKTISSELAALTSTKEMMTTKIDLMNSYMSLIRANFAKETGIVDYQENLLYVKMDNEISSNQVLKKNIESAQTLKELEKIEEELKRRYEIFKKISFQSLGLINIKKTSNHITLLKEQINLLKNKISEIRSVSNYDFSLIYQKIALIEDEVGKVETKLLSEKKLFLDKVQSGSNPEEDFTRLNNTLFKLKEEILKNFPFFEEIISLIMEIK